MSSVVCKHGAGASMTSSYELRLTKTFIATSSLALLFFLLGYPGRINSDTLDIIFQGNSGYTNTYHSPATSLLISILSHAFPTPQCIIALTAIGAAIAIIELYRVCFKGWS